MYLQGMTIINFRKYGINDNYIGFVDSKIFKEFNKNQTKLNISKTTTLIVGKNNTGKTTVMKALEKLVNGGGGFCYSDFNMNYLKDIFKNYSDTKCTENPIFPIPNIKFEIVVGLEEHSTDLVGELAHFISISDTTSSDVKIIAVVEPEDNENFITACNEIKFEEEKAYDSYLNLLRTSNFCVKYLDKKGDHIKNFKLNQLIELKFIKANNIVGENSLTKAFNRIVRYRASLLNKAEVIDNLIDDFNASVSEKLQTEHTDSINTSVEKIESTDHLKIRLSANITFEDLLNKLVTYEYVENGNYIPESQFGLGYTNLMMIIADLIEYMEKYPENSFNSRINLIAIEEPETYMHPQMQENFIKNINEAIQGLLMGRNKYINSQLIITTHSSHILNSKIQSGDSFDYINYITKNGANSSVICLKDTLIAPTTNKTENELKNKADFDFLKRHIKYKVSELFFADAVVFVEGITEETLLKFYIDNDEILRKYYISIFNINGAHGLVYHNLIKELRIPTLIITDLDIKRTKDEKEQYTQITTLTGRETTNQTLIYYNKNNEQIEDLDLDIKNSNLKIVFQNQDCGYFSTSFEEAFILTNHDNALLNTILGNLKPDIYKEIKESQEELISNTYKLQRKLSNSKSDFANELLYSYLQENMCNVPQLPLYISNGLKWLQDMLLRGEDNVVL